MRRPGFTLIEVLTALVVVTAVMLLGITVGQRWVQSEREAAFMRRLETEWNSTVGKAETGAVTDNALTSDTYQMVFWPSTEIYGSQRYEYEVTIKRNGTDVIEIPFPRTLDGGDRIVVWAPEGGFFNSPQTVHMYSKLGTEYLLTFEMGWGRLIIKKDGVPVD